MANGEVNDFRGRSPFRGHGGSPDAPYIILSGFGRVTERVAPDTKGGELARRRGPRRRPGERSLAPLATTEDPLQRTSHSGQRLSQSRTSSSLLQGAIRSPHARVGAKSLDCVVPRRSPFHCHFAASAGLETVLRKKAVEGGKVCGCVHRP